MLSKDLVKHVAKLANLPLSGEEEQKFAHQLGETIDYVNRLEEIDTKNIKPTSQVTGLENVFRDDVATPSLSQAEVLKNAKSIYKGYFKVKAILENNEP